MSRPSNKSAVLTAAKDAASERCRGYVSPIMALFRSRRMPELASSMEFQLNVLAFSLDATLGVDQLQQLGTGTEADRQQVVEHAHDAIIETGVIDRFVEYLVYLAACDWAALEETAIGTGSFVLNRLQNSADSSLNFCRALARRVKFFRGFFEPFLASSGLQAVSKPAESTVIRSLVSQAISVCINMLFKNDSEIYAELSQHGLHACVEPYLKCQDTSVSTLALILIAWIADDSQSEIFLGARENISYLVNALKSGLASSDRRFDGFAVTESAKCINRLALNDANKELLVELELLPVVRQMLISSNDSDVGQGLEILFTLSFSKKNLGRISVEFAELLKKLQAKDTWQQSKVLQSLLFHINEEAELRRKPATVDGSPFGKSSHVEVSRGQVMISYNHASKSIVQRLYKKLLESGLKVWVDFKDLTNGSTLDAMSDAVENSSIVLLCVTRLYKESNNCRLEAEYAWKCGKMLIPLLMEPRYKATGWLGMLMGTQLYYDLTEAKYPFEQKLAELLPVLVESLGGGGDGGGAGGGGGSGGGASGGGGGVGPKSGGAGGSVGPPSSISTSVLPPIAIIAPPSTSHQRLQGLRDWDAARVQAWCQERRLAHRVAALGLTGRELHFLAGAMHRSPEYFGRLMDRYFAFDRLQDLASLANAIEDLTAGR